MGKLNILYQSDDAYAAYLGISLTSLLQSNRSCEVINIYVLDIGISEENKEKIRKTCSDFKREVVMIDCRDIEDDLSHKGIPQYRNSYATYLKLCVGERLPQDINKLLYIDCDTVVTKSLEPLFESELGNCPLGMVPDALAYQYKRKLGFRRKENYYNAGIILFRLDTWRQQGWDRKTAAFLQGKEAVWLGKHDQDIINIVYRGNIAELPARYNMQSVYCAADLDAVYSVYRNVWGVTKKQLEEERENKVILHFLVFNGESPWTEKSEHPFRDEFVRYKALSRWADLEPAKGNERFLYKIEKLLYRNVPSVLFMGLFRLVHDLFHLI